MLWYKHKKPRKHTKGLYMSFNKTGFTVLGNVSIKKKK